MFLKCLFYAFQFLGTAPITIKALGTKKNKACHFLFVSSRLGILHNCILLCISLPTIYLMIEDILARSFLRKKTNLELVIDGVCAIYVVVPAFAFLLKISISAEKAIMIINKLNVIYQKRKIEFKKESPPVLLLRPVKIIVFTNVVPLIIGCFVSGQHHISNLLPLPSFLTYQMTFMQYTLILKLLHYLYQSTNTELQSVLRSKVPIFIVHNRFLGIDSQRISNKIELLREIHVLLCHLSKEVSDFYALPMFFCISNKFLILVQYFYYAAAILSDKQETATQYEILILTIWFTIVEALSLVVLARVAGLVVKESRRTGEIVGGLIAECPNKLILKQLNGFFCHLLLVQVDFNVYNLYQINEPLLTSFTSYITTYIVILLQFKGISCPSDSTDHTENVSTPPSVN
ncbi:gustatory receptor 41 [Nasonia vitripennis]|uniref:Gustatory receptor n=1 Tax=Nasonia vitripennis TaxID=7425 RepID=A0A7M6UDY1_NASVI|nr:gustatory receptor 41 [Nasonia vitripennis]